MSVCWSSTTRTSVRRKQSARCAVRASACTSCSSLRSTAGFGGGAFDVYRVCERMARVDLGLATSVFATFLGSDPILVGGTPEQRKDWLGRIAEEGILFAYGATEPEAGSDLGAHEDDSRPGGDDGQVTGYRITGRKQWISNGGDRRRLHDPGTAPGGPTWFIVEKGTAGFTHGATRGQARHPAVQHRRAVPRRRRWSPAG